MTVRDNRPATHTEVITKKYRGTYRPRRQYYQSRQQTPQQQSSTQQQSNNKQQNSNTPVITITLFTKNHTVLDVDSMDPIREGVL